MNNDFTSKDGNSVMSMPSDNVQTFSEIDTYNDEYEGTHRAFGIVAALLMLFVIFACYYGNKNATESDEDPQEPPEADHDISDAAKIAEMTPEERIQLYSKVFEKNRNQVVLKQSHIIRGDSNTEDNLDDADSEENPYSTSHDEDVSVYLALEGAREYRRSSIAKRAESIHKIRDINDAKSRSMYKVERSSLMHPRGKTPMKTQGNCIICFENMEAGDLVVWSESKSCPHVYHKDCMVGFLSHKRQKIKDIELDANPCPTCRKKFVTLINKKGKAVVNISSTPETGESTNSTEIGDASHNNVEDSTTNDPDDIESNIVES